MLAGVHGFVLGLRAVPWPFGASLSRGLQGFGTAEIMSANADLTRFASPEALLAGLTRVLATAFNR